MKQKSTLFLALVIALLLFTLQIKAAITPDIVVALDGSGNFTKIQDAINAVPSNETRQTIIFIKAGLYNTEKIIVPADKKNVTLIGESREQTIISYHIFDCSTGKCPTADAAKWSGDNITTSATLTVMANDFRAENLTIQNTAGPVGQAQAITLRGDRTVFINCDLKGYQDTIYLWSNALRSYFQNCMILGRTDYIYGSGTAFFQACEIRSWGGGWITAPSTAQTQPYGYVFNECQLTYVTNSPRNGDDGVKFRLGRPWHNYPKVAWLRCNMTDMVNPEGWGDKWNMDYANTSTDLHLYEYANTGPGADMSNRANWAGIKALTDAEALNYTVQKVLGGNDNWDPSASAPLVTTYNWTGGAATAGWLLAENWNPAATPAKGQIANANGNTVSMQANGGSFEADLNIGGGATLNISENSTASYISAENLTFTATTDVSLGGKIGTKGSNVFNITGNLTLSAALLGVHKSEKTGNGSLIVTGNNANYSGLWDVKTGTLRASGANALGNGHVNLAAGASLQIDNSNAFFPKSALRIVTGSTLILNADITLSELYIDGVMQQMGNYNNTTHPAIISGTGSVIVGRPSSFKFSAGNWDNVASYTPTLMPQAGEEVYCEGEMETTSTIYPANAFFVADKGRLRMRGNHKSTGTLTFMGGNRISYATSGTGFSLDAPIVVAGNLNFEMSSSSASNALSISGTISGNFPISVRNTRTGAITTATAILNGNNSGYTGTWDLTTPAADASSVVAIDGKSANAFGPSTINVGNKNRVIFSHTQSTSAATQLVLAAGATAVLDASVTVGKLTLNGTVYESGTFTTQSHPTFFTGAGQLTINTISSIKQNNLKPTLTVSNNKVFADHGSLGVVKVYTLSGQLVKSIVANGNVTTLQLPIGIYLIGADGYQTVRAVITK